MNVQLLDTDETAYAIQDMSQEDVILEQTLTSIAFQARIDLDFIQNVEFEAGKKQKVCFNWGGDVKQSKISKKYSNGVLIFAETVVITKEFEISSKGQNQKHLFEQIPDLIMTISDEDEKNHYSFYRFKPKDFLLSRANYKEPMIIQMKADNAISDLKQYQAGVAKLSISISEKTDFEAITSVQWPVLGPMQFEAIKIICFMFQGRDLIAGDQKGTSDATLMFYHLGSSLKSMTFPDSLNPCWNQKCLLSTYIYNGAIP